MHEIDHGGLERRVVDKDVLLGVVSARKRGVELKRRFGEVEVGAVLTWSRSRIHVFGETI